MSKDKTTKMTYVKVPYLKYCETNKDTKTITITKCSAVGISTS